MVSRIEMFNSILNQENPSDKKFLYQELILQLSEILRDETDEICCMSNFTAFLHEKLGYLWVGFYRVKGNELILGPFQGTVACTKIPFGRGVCGKAWMNGKTLIVPDVSLFEGYISCNPLTKSEIVIPVADSQGSIQSVLDIDSAKPDFFDQEDLIALEKMIKILSEKIYP